QNPLKLQPLLGQFALARARHLRQDASVLNSRRTDFRLCPGAGASVWLVCLLLVVATFLAYQPVWHAGFIWDDNYYIAENALMQRADGWWRCWIPQGVDPVYVPAVSSAWWLERRCW